MVSPGRRTVREGPGTALKGTRLRINIQVCPVPGRKRGIQIDRISAAIENEDHGMKAATIPASIRPSATIRVASTTSLAPESSPFTFTPTSTYDPP